MHAHLVLKQAEHMIAGKTTCSEQRQHSQGTMLPAATHCAVEHLTESKVQRWICGSAESSSLQPWLARQYLLLMHAHALVLQPLEI